MSSSPDIVSFPQATAPVIHPLAVVSATARIGAGVTIGPFCVIDDDVEIGSGCVLGPHVTVLRHTTLGPCCRVHPGAVLGDLPQDLRYRDCVSQVRIGTGCVIREGVTIHRGTDPGSTTIVGNDCLLMATSHVGHNCRVGDHVILANGALLGGYAEVGDFAFLSGHCLVHQYTRIGTMAMMAGGSAIQMDLPPFCITQSSVTNIVLSLNIVGLKRNGMSADERRSLRQAFNLLYRSGLAVSSAIAAIEAQIDTPSARELCRFVRSAKRGICKFFRDEPRRAPDDDQALAA